jgi:hypothetical protein
MFGSSIAKGCGATAAIVCVCSAAAAAAPRGHSELPPRARIEGIAVVAVSPPPGHSRKRRDQYPERGIVITVLDKRGTPIATMTTGGNGLFGFTVRPGSYEVMARVGPPAAVPGHRCENPRHVSLARRQRLHIRIVCSLR